MKTIKQILTVIPVLLIFISTSCIDGFTIRGNGIQESELRYTTSFSEVKSSGAFEVHITNSDEFEVVVNAETNILPYIDSEVHNHRLTIDIQGLHNVKNTQPMEVFISMPTLEGLKQSGSGSITTDYFTCTNFDADISGSGIIEAAVDCHYFSSNISGSGKVFVSGVADYSELKISGSGQIDSYDLYVNDCEAVISGSGDVFVNVDHYLDASISGSGSVFYIGHPDIHQNISGSGRIINDN